MKKINVLKSLELPNVLSKISIKRRLHIENDFLSVVLPMTVARLVALTNYIF